MRLPNESLNVSVVVVIAGPISISMSVVAQTVLFRIVDEVQEPEEVIAVNWSRSFAPVE